jgi:hypothetical protein
MTGRKPSQLKPKIKKKCQICEKVFYSAYGHQKICSQKCRKKHHQAYDKKHYKWNREKRLSRSKLNNKARRVSNPDLERNARYKYVYGITLSDFRDMIKVQNNCCYICNNEFSPKSHYTKPHLDHDHSSGSIRKVLCGHCNGMLGRANDEVEILKNAVKYLKRYSK